VDHAANQHDWRRRLYSIHRNVNDAAPISVPKFSNVAAAVKWDTYTRKVLDEILDEEEDDEHAD
jgi:hypothetical protein